MKVLWALFALQTKEKCKHCQARLSEPKFCQHCQKITAQVRKKRRKQQLLMAGLMITLALFAQIGIWVFILL